MGESLLNDVLISSTIITIIVGSFYNLQQYSPIKNDKLIHFIAYFFLSLLISPYFTYAKVFIILFLMGASIEILQPLVGRKCCIYDQLANTTGIISSITLLYLWGAFFGSH